MLDDAATEPLTRTSADESGEVGDLLAMADGRARDLGALSRQELLALQWEQERDFARRILASSKGSAERAETIRRAYETVTRIYAAAWHAADGRMVMGYNPRDGQLVLSLLRRQQRRGQAARLFEIGYSSGELLKLVSDAGFPVAGIEVSPTLRREATKRLGPSLAAGLCVGDLLRDELPPVGQPFSLVYWNDVFEHVPPDEILDYLRRIHDLLAPGGQLVTITPNWHRRPSDVTRVFAPPRTEAAGLHLKEYTLREVTTLLRAAGFRWVATPLVATSGRVVLFGRGLAGLKRLVEPALEALPFSLAGLLCRGFGLATTIATKSALGGAP